MSHFETDRTAETARGTGTSHALVPLAGATDNVASSGIRVGRPSAGFLAQLIVSGEPEFRPSRRDRTRVAAALYAQAARLCA